MGKKHKAFFDEPQEAQVNPEQPEISKLADSEEPAIPAENPGTMPDEVQEVEKPGKLESVQDNFSDLGKDEFYK